MIAEKILELKPTPMSKDEFMKKTKEDYKNKLLLTNQCSKERYKVSGNLHVWGWTDFRREINGKIIEYDAIGNIIDSITYEVEKEMDENILRKYGLTAEKINLKYI
ncbi:hypothetical protein K2F43_08380 [Clostridium estertheticum]|uniref:hypothetical protein n=1 Tax=Clostridium estertheticum TaxID=238834 RepID=UPI001C6DE5E6|nr:hypothetical protein [Clostridium estertheticum]MBW9171221.1 hypothetical protein [Clostridium estertheticum]WLC73922.1 hypothetical protein KTC99_14160 [Clostridium estertheticum]